MVGVSLLLACVTTACASGGSSLARTSDLVSEQIGANRLERGEHIKLGPLRLALLRTLLRLSGEELDDEATAFLTDVERLEVASFHLRPTDDAADPVDLSRLEDELADDGWSRVVRSREDDESTVVMVKEDATGQVRGIFVISVDRHELELVHLAGRLDRSLALAQGGG